MQLIYLIGGLIGVYVPTRLLYRYFFNAPMVLKPLQNRIVDATSSAATRLYFKKRQAALFMPINHKGEVTAPTLLSTSAMNVVGQEGSRIFGDQNAIQLRVFKQKNVFHVLNREAAINYGDRLNAKLGLKVNFEEAVDCVPTLLKHKYPLIDGILRSQPTTHLITLCVNVNEQSENYMTISESKVDRTRLHEYPLIICSSDSASADKNHETQTDTSPVYYYETKPGNEDEEILKMCSFGCVFLITKGQQEKQFECVQIIDEESNNSYADAFVKLLKSLDGNSSKQSEQPLIFKKSMLYVKQLEEKLVGSEVKEVMLVRSDGVVCRITEIQINQTTFSVKPKQDIFSYIAKLQSKCQVDHLTYFQQSIDQLH